MGAAAALPGQQAEELPQTRVSSPGRDAWRRFRQNWAAMASLIVIGILVVMAVFAPLMHTASPLALDYFNLHKGPSAHHWFGTDGTGRDEYSRLVYGLRVPLIVGILGAAITTIIGALLGVISGYAGGLADSFLSRFTDLIFAFPAFLLALLCVSLFGQALDPYFGGAGRVLLLTVVFAVVGWPALMRFVRSLALSLKEQQFVEAARTSGSSSWAIVTRHLLPNMWGLILIQCSFIIIGFVSTEAILSILGLGVQAPNPDVGVMLWDGQQNIDFNHWEVFFPSAALTIIILAFTFLGDGIRDAVDPRMNS
ncbi:MAG: ABC transporter permease [Chloroflexota bacterium]